MPLLGLGHGGELRREVGPERLSVPNAIHVDLATWAKIPFLYTAATRRQATQLARLAVEPERSARLVTALEHELAFAVGRGKIAANGSGAAARIAMGFIQPGLSAPVPAPSLAAVLQGCGDELAWAIDKTLALADVPASQIGSDAGRRVEPDANGRR